MHNSWTPIIWKKRLFSNYPQIVSCFFCAKYFCYWNCTLFCWQKLSVENIEEKKRSKSFIFEFFRTGSFLILKKNICIQNFWCLNTILSFVFFFGWLMETCKKKKKKKKKCWISLFFENSNGKEESWRWTVLRNYLCLLHF